ncbi:MAG TPA: BLUF domain-containing protein [Amaricoccus sp.]|uniref:BLUF domain-containing protein n=1 Tax=Amaricoccus sp. TaxID=1872485 RepID=UPI002C2EBA22|nr:BLUF domain-containing protein [Amaricoccus sp.]HMR54104.1 BLUF domain-containing protein [Amaricoccus sp.]HMR60428.1 BLUF domain-containing protein [Amaricoccus sp.]HMU01121.1 BLUF domain-containing protein [Amaricoccus sp.]
MCEKGLCTSKKSALGCLNRVPSSCQARRQGPAATRGRSPVIATVRQTRKDEFIQLVYVSTAAETLRPADLDTIAEVSRRRNEQAGLTGFLLHQGPRFYGVLEGPTRALFARMEAIVTDPRHRRVVVLREDTITERRFRNWSFGILPAVPIRPAQGATVEFISDFARRM